MTAPSTHFDLPDDLCAAEPPEARGVRRDRVRLLAADSNGVRHRTFDELGSELQAGDVVVVNTSATIAAAVDGVRAGGRPVAVHFSTALDDGSWLVEVRPPGVAAGPVSDAVAGEVLTLVDGVRLTLVEPHGDGPLRRLWRAAAAVEGGIAGFLARCGRPISYAYLTGRWPITEYQTVFARDPGSAEMPSAGRPFSAELVTDLVSRGVGIAPITLHTGVSSLEQGEPPLPERYVVPEHTARVVNQTRAAGGRVIAVGTTVTRALETAAGAGAIVRPAAGWTSLVLGPQRPARVVDGLITGWHAPGASHLHLLEAVVGSALVGLAYDEALRERYLWHEFGDSCLLVADRY